MRNLLEPDIHKHRVPLMGAMGDRNLGAFMIQRGHEWLRIIAANARGWDHVSVSLIDRCPTWDEMEFVKRLFFKPEETAMQLHVPVTDHINHHPYCLHIWRPHNFKIPLPPSELVGPK